MLKPFPYQKEGIDFLARRNKAYLADQMGLGKTIQAVMAAREVGATRPLVICPASLVPNWEREWEKWGGPGTPDIVSYSSLHRAGSRYDLVIADEAHYMKTPSAQRTRAGLRLARTAQRAWLLSGTPMPNHPGELWAPMKALWPEKPAALGIHNGATWLQRFCLTRDTPYGPKPYAVRNGKILREMLRGVMLRRRLDEVALDLPPLRVTLQTLLTPESVRRELGSDREVLEEEYTSTLRRLLGEAKAPLVADQIIEELQDGAYSHIVVLYYHRKVGALLEQAFARSGVSTVGFHGGTPPGERQLAVDTFQAGDATVFLAQQTAAGVGITLTQATEIVLVEPAWSPDDNDQAIKRIHRIGQDKPCRARIFALSKTLDDAIMGTLAQKMRMRKEVFDE